MNKFNPVHLLHLVLLYRLTVLYCGKNKSAHNKHHIEVNAVIQHNGNTMVII